MMALHIKNVRDGGFRYIDIGRSEHKAEGKGDRNGGGVHWNDSSVDLNRTSRSQM